jgi:hypothetical protein
MASRNYIPRGSRWFRGDQHIPWQPASPEAAVSHRGGDAVERQKISTAQSSPQLRRCKSGAASCYRDVNMHLDKRQRWPRNAQLPPVLNHASCARPAASAAVTRGQTFIGTSRPSQRWGIVECHGPPASISRSRCWTVASSEHSSTPGVMSTGYLAACTNARSGKR